MSVRFCFTENNPEEDIIYWETCPLVRYAVYQLEMGEQGTPHLQGYIELHSKQRLSALKKILPRAHWEKARGSFEQNYAYCTKEPRLAGPYVYGEHVEERQRTDLKQFQQMVLSGKKEREIASELFNVWARHPNLYMRYKFLLIEPRDGSVDVQCILCIGAPGTGKSRWAQANYPNAYRRPSGERWWPNYVGQKEVILDDFSGSFMRLHDFLRIVDRYQLTMEVKNGHVEMAATTFIITTNIDPVNWWNDQFYTPMLQQAVLRRITKIQHFFAENEFREFSTYEEYKNSFCVVPALFVSAD